MRRMRSTALLHSKRSRVANPSYAAYTWSSASVDVLIFGNALEIGALAISWLQRSQLPVRRSRCPYQALLTLRAEKLQGRVDAVSLQGGGQRMALRIVV
jgi:hypothetical protein